MVSAAVVVTGGDDRCVCGQRADPVAQQRTVLAEVLVVVRREAQRVEEPGPPVDTCLHLQGKVPPGPQGVFQRGLRVRAGQREARQQRHHLHARPYQRAKDRSVDPLDKRIAAAGLKVERGVDPIAGAGPHVTAHDLVQEHEVGVDVADSLRNRWQVAQPRFAQVPGSNPQVREHQRLLLESEPAVEHRRIVVGQRHVAPDPAIGRDRG